MTSVDLFFVIATVSLILITFFSCWALLYFALILKKVLFTLEEFERGWNGVTQGFEDIREKLINLRAYTAVGVGSIKTLIELFQKHLENRGVKNPKRKKKSDSHEDESND